MVTAQPEPTVTHVKANPKPITVFPGVVWSPIGKPCEIDECGELAYRICDISSCGFDGYGKAMCIKHCNIEISSHKRIKRL